MRSSPVRERDLIPKMEIRFRVSSFAIVVRKIVRTREFRFLQIERAKPMSISKDSKSQDLKRMKRIKMLLGDKLDSTKVGLPAFA